MCLVQCSTGLMPRRMRHAATDSPRRILHERHCDVDSRSCPQHVGGSCRTGCIASCDRSGETTTAAPYIPLTRCSTRRPCTGYGTPPAHAPIAPADTRHAAAQPLYGSFVGEAVGLGVLFGVGAGLAVGPIFVTIVHEALTRGLGASLRVILGSAMADVLLLIPALAASWVFARAE